MMEEPDNDTMLGAFLEGMRPKPTRIGLRDEGWGGAFLVEGTGSTKRLKEKSLSVVTLQEKPRGVATL